jgi:ubiquinone/menaquinone biosynthesis C-methylase UbiE
MATSVLDVTTGGKHIWHGEQKNADRVVFLDRRKLESESIKQQPNWEVAPDVQADFRELPFRDGAFDLVCFDPPHRVTDGGMEAISGIIETKYGALRAESWQSDILAGFEECWRVLCPGGTLTMKWNDAKRSNADVLAQLPETPLYGTNTEKTDTTTSWWVFHKPRD